MKRILTALACAFAFAMACNAQMTAARMMAYVGAALPYDREIAWIGQNDKNTAWIDTGLVWDSGSWACEADVYFSSNVVENYVISQHSSGQGCGYAFVYINDNDLRLCYVSNLAADAVVDQTFFGVFHHFKCNYKSGEQHLNVDDSLILTATRTWVQGATESGMRIIIGGVQTFGGKASGVRFGSVSIGHNGTLIRDFITVMDKSGVPCMYDRVTKSFFYNQGTGTFLYGEK